MGGVLGDLFLYYPAPLEADPCKSPTWSVDAAYGVHDDCKGCHRDVPSTAGMVGIYIYILTIRSSGFGCYVTGYEPVTRQSGF